MTYEPRGSFLTQMQLVHESISIDNLPGKVIPEKVVCVQPFYDVLPYPQ